MCKFTNVGIFYLERNILIEILESDEPNIDPWINKSTCEFKLDQN